MMAPTRDRLNGIFESRDKFLFIAGPCAVEDLNQMEQSARKMTSLGVPVLRSEIFKPRTNPDYFQGVGISGLEILKRVKKETGILVITEVLDVRYLEDVLKVADIIQVGSRNSQNFSLLREVGNIDKPVLIKRGFGNTIDELIQSTRYISREGNDRIMVVERGIRTFEHSVRFTLDVAAIPVLKERLDYPVLVDPSHPAGRRKYVVPLALAATAAGADGLMVEVHPDPPRAKSDSEQQLSFDEFSALVEKVKSLLPLVGKRLL